MSALVFCHHLFSVANSSIAPLLRSSDYVRYRFTEIANHEANHVNVLTSGLSAAGATPVKECSYNFGDLTPASFIATSQVLEGVGVAAYLGAAPSVQSKAYLALAGSILV